jgi:hypothetical protein
MPLPATKHLPVILFWLLIGGLCSQPFVINAFGEPYPTITFPVFRGGGARIGEPVRTLRVSLTVEFVDGTTSAVTRDDLFRAVPRSIRIAVVNENLGPTRLESVDSRSTPSTSILPGRASLWHHMGNAAQAHAVLPWIGQQLRDLYPGRQPATLIIRWDEVVVWRGHQATANLVREASLPLHP